MSYKLLPGVGVIRIEDGATIPADAGNVDWVAYQAWLAAGNVPLAADPAPVPVDQNDFNNLTKAFRAKCVSDLAFRLGVLPGALTAAQVQSERTRIKNIADALS